VQEGGGGGGGATVTRGGWIAVKKRTRAMSMARGWVVACKRGHSTRTPAWVDRCGRGERPRERRKHDNVVATNMPSVTSSSRRRECECDHVVKEEGCAECGHVTRRAEHPDASVEVRHSTE
jgi:hypothetical protein